MNQPNWVSIEDVPPGRYGPLTILPPLVGNAPIDPSIRMVDLVPARPGPLKPKPIPRARFEQAVSHLPDELREPLSRVYLKKESVASVAAALAIPPERLRARLNRGWKAVHAWLQGNRPGITSAMPPG